MKSRNSVFKSTSDCAEMCFDLKAFKRISSANVVLTVAKRGQVIYLPICLRFIADLTGE